MEAAMAVRPSLSHDRMSSAYHGARSQSAGGMHPRSPRSEPSMENMAPILMPSGLNSMLKNTTETGDIGMFSIKPTRLPRHNASATLSSLPRAAYHDLAAQAPDFSLFKVPPRMDDRRRLPSYNRDVTSEIASLHERNSIKSSSTGSRLFDESEQRSYSMTQTSLNVSRLANHRSYASLRSQGDMGLGQRPRSPFAYPTRLKRPGFRPSSPALTDGGIVDYSRRAEIGRESSVVSPASTSTTESQRRMPPTLSVRTDTNRCASAPGSSVPPSPRQRGLHAPTGSIASRRSPSPSGIMPQSPLQREFYAEGSPSVGRKFQAPINPPAPPSAPSPSRSVVSNAPVVPSRLRSRASSSAASEKVPASPLYYDYTESFYPEDEVDASPMDEFQSPPPAPPFMIDRTIHEDRELSSDWSYLAMTDLKGRGFLASEGFNLTPEEAPDNTDAQQIDLSYAAVTRSSSLQSIQSRFVINNAPAEHSVTAQVDGDGGISSSNDSIRQHPGYNGSGYGSGSTDPAPMDEVGNLDEAVQSKAPEVARAGAKSLTDLIQLPMVANSAAQSVYENAQSEIGSFATQAMVPSNTGLGSTENIAQAQQGKRISQSVSLPAFKTTAPPDVSNFSPQIVGLALTTAELSEVRNSDEVDEDVFPASYDEQQTPARRIVQTDVPISRQDSCQPYGALQLDPKFKLNKYKSDSDLTTSRFGIHEKNRYTIDGTRSNIIRTGPRNPREFRVSSSSEIMSPTPISPARQLRVKNSIPQFMKALPPLPLRQPVTERISLTDPRKSTSRRPPPLKLDPSTLAPSGKLLSVVHNPVTPTLLTPKTAKESPMMQKQFANSSQPFLSRWRLKARSPAVIPKPSPPASRPWNLEDSYPWNSEASAVEPLPAILHKKSGLFNPKLRLNIMKSSDSLGGTVRVNRDAAQASKDIPTLGPPKDLFSSPSSGLTNIFRQVSHHLQHSGDAGNSASAIPPHPEVLLAHEEAKAKWNQKATKTAPKSTMTQQENASLPMTRSAQQTKVDNGGTLPRLKQAASRDLRLATNIPLRSSDHRGSLRHEGSQQELHDSIRKKVRARLPMSHSRAQSRKSEDVISRPKTAASSAPLINIGFDGANDYTPPAPQVKKSSRLKKKVSSWFKGAKATVLGCVRHKHGADVSMDLGVAPPAGG